MTAELTRLTPDTPDNTGKIQVSGRQADGRFVRGHSGNLRGRPKGALNNATIIAGTILSEKAAKITSDSIAYGLSGFSDKVLLLLLDRILPKRKDIPVSFDLPPMEDMTDPVEIQVAVLQAVAEGRLTPLEGQTISAMTDRILKTLKEQNAEA